MSGTTSQAVSITPQRADSRFVALSFAEGLKIIAEGTTVANTKALARQTGREFSIMFLPRPGHSCVL
ncbi:MAG: hypothetical protein ACI9OU_001055 [Candidatus Promineifilaceae bacterium]|jgi:hypothetical protein